MQKKIDNNNLNCNSKINIHVGAVIKHITYLYNCAYDWINYNIIVSCFLNKNEN